MNPADIESHLKLVLLQWMIIIAAAWFFGRLGKRMGQPLAVGEILAGLLLGPSALGLIWPKDWPPSPSWPRPNSAGRRCCCKPAGVLLFFLALLYVAGPALKWFWKKSAARVEPADASKMPSTFLAALLICLFGCCLVTNFLGVFSFFGAFLLGVALHEQADLVKAWRDQVSNFVMVALAPVYFTNTGLRAEIGSINSSAAWQGCALVLLTGAAGKLFGCWAAARASGQTQRESLCIAALMNTRALMGLVAINVGYELGLLPRELFTMFVIMSLATTAMTGPLLKWSLPVELRPLLPGFDSLRRSKGN
jgi:Kef-type K+ transport system membrane component KefB